MVHIDENKISAASELVLRERCARISLLTSALGISDTEAQQILTVLAARGVVEEPNPNGLYHVALSRLERSQTKHSAQAIHVRIILDLALYMLKNVGDTELVKDVMVPDFNVSRDKVRKAISAATGSKAHESLADVAEAIAQMPTFSAKFPFEQIAQELRVACTATHVGEKEPASNLEKRLSGLLHATRYLKRRLMEGEGAHSRAVDWHVHKNISPQGRAKNLDPEIHEEHVVPCALVRKKAMKLLSHGIPEDAVAEWIEPYLRIVIINDIDRIKLDGPLRLRTVMPENWQFGGDCIYARLHVLGIEFTPPAEGPSCTCAAGNAQA
ncbi:MAG: hypothetical protein ACTS6O_04855 [Giesbergeria sp.]